MKKMLLTGFEPFDGERMNPAIEVVRRLQGRSVGRYAIEGLELPTVFGKSISRLVSAVEETAPDAVICLGQAGGRAEITFERIAVNVNDANIADNEGNKPVDTPVVPEGPAAYWSTLPVKSMVSRLRASGIPASVSLTAGTFVCNHLFYGLMHHIAVSGKPVQGGFVHIPYLPGQASNHPGAPSMALEQMVFGLEQAIAVMTE
ncbi:pyroglutamyl-peptidase I [Paenibacillus macerans]|uniref:pyroglutamyl-peptidase I n=1 Tax=Paenibacillus macerans TaxID=44252 RepID=UPI003D3108BB